MNMNGMAGGMPQARPSGAQNGGNSQFNQYILQQIAMQGVPQGWQTQIDRGNRFTTITTLCVATSTYVLFCCINPYSPFQQVYVAAPSFTCFWHPATGSTVVEQCYTI